VADKRSCHAVTPTFTQRLNSNLRSYLARTRTANCHWAYFGPPYRHYCTISIYDGPDVYQASGHVNRQDEFRSITLRRTPRYFWFCRHPPRNLMDQTSSIKTSHISDVDIRHHLFSFGPQYFPISTWTWIARAVFFLLRRLLVQQCRIS
jgi:hypothetical protein